MGDAGDGGVRGRRPLRPTPTRIAVVGGGIAGVACAAGLQQAGHPTVLFEKAKALGGRMATRAASWRCATAGTERAAFDHGAAFILAHRPRFRALLERAEAAGVVARWRPLVHRAWPGAAHLHAHLPVPDMPALCRHLATGVTLELQRSVQRLQRSSAGWHLAMDDGGRAGPFTQVVLAVAPAQAAPLLAGHRDDWADALAARPALPCWTLTAVTDDVDWPWDAAELERGPLGWVFRNDRKPGRAQRHGRAVWVAHATPQWSAAHAQAARSEITAALQAALGALLPSTPGMRWHHVAVHRWRGTPADGCALKAADPQFGWDEALGLGVCGEPPGDASVEAAWSSGDELADTIAAWFEFAGDRELALESAEAP